MKKGKNEIGVYQLDNGFWAYRFIIKINGKNKTQRRTKGEDGKPFKTSKQASRARLIAIEQEKLKAILPQPTTAINKSVQDVYNEYCNYGRNGKAFSTIKKQDSLWKNHINPNFGNKLVAELTKADIDDYLANKYYTEDRAYSYVESFLKMFYLILGQAHSRNYITTDFYNKMCVDKNTKLRMPKAKVDEDTDIIYFTREEMSILDTYFKNTNAETAYMLGKYCGLRISECYGLKWNNVNLDEGYITIDRQMSYHDGIIRLIPVKTKSGRRKIYLCKKLKKYLIELHKQKVIHDDKYLLQRTQNQTIILDKNEKPISSLELVNTLPNGKLQTTNSMKYHSKILNHNYNLHFKYHYLRHTYGTRLAESNVPTHILCTQMGHSSINVTQKYYLALSKDGLDDYIEKLDSII